MPEERALKEDGEDLARLAVGEGTGLKQLREAYDVVRKKPLPYAEACVQRQLAKALEGTVRGAGTFQRILELMKKYGENRSSLERALMYAVMLYPYYEKEPLLKVKGQAEQVIREVVRAGGYSLERVEWRIDGRVASANVHIPGFRENPKVLAGEIERALRSRVALKEVNVKIWKESR